MVLVILEHGLYYIVHMAEIGRGRYEFTSKRGIVCMSCILKNVVLGQSQPY